jgi:hypothetical protein
MQRSFRALRQLIERLERASHLDPRQATKARDTLRALERAKRSSDIAATHKAVGEFASLFIAIFSELQPPE